jgi:hypothetical protein
MTINTAHELQAEFNRYDRSENFTPAGVRVLFDYLEEISEGSGEDINLDIVGLCCDYSEDTFEDIAANYRIDLTNRAGETIEDEEEIERIVLDYLNNNTVVCGVTGTTAVYAAF